MTQRTQLIAPATFDDIGHMPRHGLTLTSSGPTTPTDRQRDDGGEAVPLTRFTRLAPVLFDADGWPLLRDHATILFGDGGTGKSYLGLYAGGLLARHGARVLMVDWELEGQTHSDRLQLLFGDTAPLLHYLQGTRPLVHDVARIRRNCLRLGIDYILLDSIGYATDGPPEAAEHALSYFRALKGIGVRGSLSTAHVNRSTDGADQKPFGSVFWHNSARATWFVKQVGTEPTRLRVHLTNRKSNLGAMHTAAGFDFDFRPDRTIVTRVTSADVVINSAADPVPTWQRVAAFIKAGHGVPRTIPEIAAALHLKPDTIKHSVRRKGHVFTTVPRLGGASTIALVDSRVS